MIALTTLALIFASSSPARQIGTSSECALGQVVLTDQARSWTKGAEILINPDDDTNTSLFARCPGLITSLPAKMRFASKAEITRLSDIVPSNSATIFHLGVPTISRDGRNATVSYSYACSGLCGAGYQARYKLKRGIWKRVGIEEQMWVS